MAILSGVNVGAAPLPLNGTIITALRLGTTAQITTGAASATVALPVDANSNKYTTYMLVSLASGCWFNFNTAGDAAVATAANTYAMASGSSPWIIVPPPGTTNVSAIQDTAAGHLLIIGLA